MLSLSLAFTGVVGTLVYGALLLFPIITLSLHHSTLTGMYEELIGYRYFYNLRTLYETSYLFLPQGDLVNLIFKGIHLVLSAVGYPADHLFPRIDLFSYLSVAFLQCLNLLCFWWAAAAIPSPSSRLLAALFLGGLNYVPGTSAIYAIIQPDYIALFAAFSLLTMGSIFTSESFRLGTSKGCRFRIVRRGRAFSEIHIVHTAGDCASAGHPHVPANPYRIYIGGAGGLHRCCDLVWDSTA